MKQDLNINVSHVTRVEGHGRLLAEVRAGEVVRCEWRVIEAPRYFEAMARGRTHEEMHHLVSRICGICSIGHTLASVKATESAFGIQVSEQTLRLRKLALHGENMQSHTLHVGYLVLPDLTGTPSVLPLAATHKEELLAVIRLHKLANDISNIIGGRTTHPLRLVPGGMAKLPTEEQLEGIVKDCEEAREDLWATAKLIKSLEPQFVDFARETEFIALVHPAEYALYDGQIGSTDGGEWPVTADREIANEYCVPQSTAKWCRHNRAGYMVGAIARFNLNLDKLTPSAKEAAEFLGLKPMTHKPFDNNLAQLVECFDSVEDARKLALSVLEDGLRLEKPAVRVRAGRGVGAVEVPRGILFHDYDYDAQGRCTGCNIVIPTNQNHGNLSIDLSEYLPTLVELPEAEVKRRLEMVIRAYDPCISCSTHLIVKE